MYILVHQVNFIVTRVEAPDDVIRKIGGGEVRWSPMTGLKLQANEFAEAPIGLVNKLEKAGFSVVAMANGCDKMAWTMHRNNECLLGTKASSLSLAEFINNSPICRQAERLAMDEENGDHSSKKVHLGGVRQPKLGKMNQAQQMNSLD